MKFVNESLVKSPDTLFEKCLLMFNGKKATKYFFNYNHKELGTYFYYN